MHANGERFLEAYIEANKLIQTGRPEMPLTIANTFLAVVLWGDGDDKDPPCLLKLSQQLGMAPQSMSRHVRYLSEWERRNVPGCGWISIEPHPQDARQRVARLTRRGHLIADRIRKVLADAR